MRSVLRYMTRANSAKSITDWLLQEPHQANAFASDFLTQQTD